MPRKTQQTVKKGLEALADADVQDLVQKNEENQLLKKEMKNLLKHLQPHKVAVETAIAETEVAMTERIAKISCVRQTQDTLRVLENDPDSDLYQLMEEKKRLEDELNANAREVNGVTIYRTPDSAPVRENNLRTVTAEIGKYRNGVGEFWAGFYGVDLDEAFELVRSDDKAYENSKSNQSNS